jgi:flagellar operon protein (TIGR03826 family)
MGMNVANCPRCGKVYVKNHRDVCPACIKEIDLQLENCLKYLKQNRGTTIQDLSEATEVPVKQIAKFIREGRISIIGAPNMTYPCEVCFTPIRESNICESCRQRLAKDVTNSKEDEDREKEIRKQENKVTFNITDRLKDRLK